MSANQSKNYGKTTGPIENNALLLALPYGAAICLRDGKVLQANNALGQILGISAEDLLHHKASFLSQGIVDDLEHIFASGRFWCGDITVVNAAHQNVPCRLTISALEWIAENQSVPAVLLTLMENSNNRIAEQNLLAHNQDRNDVNATKTDFLANMGHELRTPLNAIIGNSELIAEAILGDITQTYRECGQDIYEAGTHLLSLVNDVLDTAKMNDGAMTIKPESNNAVTIAREAIKLIADDFNRRRHVLTLNLPDQAITINCDRLKLKQILINILTNAGKYTPDGGEISLELHTTANEAIFTISDTGVGIAPQDIPRALTRFSQLHPKGIKESAGTGLGLPLAKMLTELHGGRFIIESKPGCGTAVKICLPMPHAG
ncbi:PAS domain-containing sensor histidine kinase [Thalassospira sp. MCCC 1A01428]|uniref:PAS domain-containing sensor histidine kinase n=1 Tax=Thalassospira sp. MCCC 1A01428 TaxID=1470575 RepID=UPI000A1EA68D|nr:PAS domain-containing sensor histidine kinase [Thalassospira sp. MCCC 1A01428]OSQ42393.1 histidine kinase [Thalassospira sp. MCCC 1A01428]